MLLILSCWYGRNLFWKSHTQAGHEIESPSYSRSAFYTPVQNNSPCCLSSCTSKYWDAMFPEYCETRYSPPEAKRANIFSWDHMFCVKKHRRLSGLSRRLFLQWFSVSGSSSGCRQCSFCKCVPALGCNVKFISPFRKNFSSIRRVGHITYHTYAFI